MHVYCRKQMGFRLSKNFLVNDNKQVLFQVIPYFLKIPANTLTTAYDSPPPIGSFVIASGGIHFITFPAGQNHSAYNTETQCEMERVLPALGRSGGAGKGRKGRDLWYSARSQDARCQC